jgi:hypothetical protein
MYQFIYQSDIATFCKTLLNIDSPSKTGSQVRGVRACLVIII